MNRAPLLLLLMSSACLPPVEPWPNLQVDAGPFGGGFGGGGSFGGDGGGGSFGGGFGGDGSTFCSAGFAADPPVANVTPPAISGGSMTALSDGTLVIGDVDRDQLWVVEGDGVVVRQVALPIGAEPGRIVPGPAGTAFAVLRRSNQIVQLTAATGALTYLDTCRVPRGLVYRAASSQLLVGCADGTIATHTNGVRGELAVDAKISDLRDLVDEGDHLIATSFRSAKIFSIALPTGHTSALAYAGVPEDGEPRVAWRAIPTAQGTLVSYQTERITTLPSTTQTCGAYGAPSATMPSLVAGSLGLVRNGAVQQLSISASAVLPVDVAANAAGETVTVTAGSNSVETSWTVGLGADGGVQSDGGFISIFADGGFFGFDNRVFLSGQPVAVTMRGDQWVIFEREPAGLAFLRRDDPGVIEIRLPGQSVLSTGHEIFHRATFANIACASCHPEAGDDEHVWQFAEGARRTPTLRGGLIGTAPFHWTGDEPDMPALVSDVMVRRMSGLDQSPNRSDALLTWIDRQPAMAAPPTDAASVTRGAALFASAQTQCTTCHVGSLGTNNATLVVGTDGAFQVPRLVELGWRTRWFHDGRVTTPADRFGALGGGEAHGHTSQLSAAERLDLLEYLKSR